jgi:hypothetical protein
VALGSVSREAVPCLQSQHISLTIARRMTSDAPIIILDVQKMASWRCVPVWTMTLCLVAADGPECWQLRVLDPPAQLPFAPLQCV